MPTYEYRCKACEHEFERFQNISAAPVRTCPSCKKRRVERLISAGGGFIFKGPGFYATDYRKDGPSGSRSETGSADSSGKEEGSAAGTSSKSDTSKAADKKSDKKKDAAS